MAECLDVYLHSIYAGRLIRESCGTMSFTYNPVYVAQGLPTLSLSLPPREKRYRGKIVSAFFFGALPGFVAIRHTPGRLMRRWLWNCLPGSLARKKKERYSHLPKRKRWAWLIDKGIEVGAVDLRPCGSPLSISDKSSEMVLDRRLISQINENPRLYASVDGQNYMIPVRFNEEQKLIFIKGRGPTFSTHFVKHMGKWDSAINELFCMRLARFVGLNVPDVSLHFIDGVPCFLIKRYDRMQSGQFIGILHQESLCQALGVPTGVWLERHGGASIKKSLALLQEYSVKPEYDKAEFLARVVFDHLIGCRDISGRNVSLLYRNGLPELAPAYDFSISSSNALKTPMSIGGERRSGKIRIQHWYDAVIDSDRRILYQQLHRLTKDCEEKANVLVGKMERENLQSSVCQIICEKISQYSNFIREELPHWPAKVGY